MNDRYRMKIKCIRNIDSITKKELLKINRNALCGANSVIPGMIVQQLQDSRINILYLGDDVNFDKKE